jgi:hypothetical protein
MISANRVGISYCSIAISPPTAPHLKSTASLPTCSISNTLLTIIKPKLFIFTMSAIMQPTNNFTITGSIQEHPKIWAISAFLWVVSCYIFGRLQVRALDQISRGERILYITPKIKEGNVVPEEKRTAVVI